MIDHESEIAEQLIAINDDYVTKIDELRLEMLELLDQVADRIDGNEQSQSSLAHELQHMIIEKKGEFESAIASKYEHFAEHIAAAQEASEEFNETLRQLFENSMRELAEDLELAITDAINSCNEDGVQFVSTTNAQLHQATN